jgi:hypothetical protein
MLQRSEHPSRSEAVEVLQSILAEARDLDPLTAALLAETLSELRRGTSLALESP